MAYPLVADMNHDNKVDFTRLAASGCVGVIHKSDQGLEFTDNRYAKRREQAKAVGLEFAAYSFNTHDNVAASVDHFFRVAAPDARTGMWLDFERNPKSDMTIAQAREFLDRVDQKLGRYCGIYGGDKLKENLPHHDGFFAAHPLWLCEYPRAGTIEAAVTMGLFRLPVSWQTTGALIVQFTGDGAGPLPHTLPGLEKGADLSFFNGTPEALRAAWSLPSIVTV